MLSVGDAFLWFGRLVSYKQPMRYVELARTIPEARFIVDPRHHQCGPGEMHEIRTAAGAVSNLEVLDPLPHAELGTLIDRSSPS